MSRKVYVVLSGEKGEGGEINGVFTYMAAAFELAARPRAKELVLTEENKPSVNTIGVWEYPNSVDRIWVEVHNVSGRRR